MTTKNKIAEQVLYRINGGITKTSSPVQKEDVIEALGQIINTMFKLNHFTVTLQAGETIPSGLMLATYGPVTVTSLGRTKAKCTLPVMPVSLPRNMGIFQVSPYEDFRCTYIPIQSGQYELLKSQPLISNLLGQVGYEPYGNRIELTQDITIDNITELYFRLVVLEVGQYDDYEALPIPFDMETDIVDELIKRFAPVTGTMKFSDIIAPQPVK